MAPRPVEDVFCFRGYSVHFMTESCQLVLYHTIHGFPTDGQQSYNGKNIWSFLIRRSPLYRLISFRTLQLSQRNPKLSVRKWTSPCLAITDTYNMKGTELRKYLIKLFSILRPNVVSIMNMHILQTSYMDRICWFFQWKLLRHPLKK